MAPVLRPVLVQRAPHARQMYGRGGPGGLGGGGGGPVQEPAWLGTAFFALVILSFIPGPWQIVLGPIISLINLFYMFKFGIFLLGIAAVFGLSWWFDMTTLEGQCPRCGTFQRGPKGDPFNCLACGEDLEAKDDVFVRYVKSGKVEGSAFEQLKDFASEAATKARSAGPAAAPPGPSSSSGGPKPPRKGTEVVDVEVV